MPSLPSPRGKTRPRLEIIPFIDIMFFLLATFMMVSLSMIKNEGVSVNLPAASTGQPVERKSSVTISFTEEGTVYLDGEEILLEAMSERLSELQIRHKDLKVFINGDRGADFGRGVELLDKVRSLGIQKVTIQTKGKNVGTVRKK